MKGSHLIAVLVAFMAVGAFANDASAYYHAGMGRFLSRDPHGTLNAPMAPRLGTAGPATAGGFLQRDPIPARLQSLLQYADGMNLYQYDRSSPNGGLDPFGLDTYQQNRQLAAIDPIDGDPNATRAPVTHTFVYTTNPDGSLEHTYSWGNAYDENGNGDWFRDAPEDVRAARQAIRDRQLDEAGEKWWFQGDVYGPRVGDETLDQYVEEAFQGRVSNPNHRSRHPNRWLWDNCKTESTSLIEDAERLRTRAQNGEGGEP